MTGRMVVIGWASEMTAVSPAGKKTSPAKFGFRTKLVMPVPPGPAMGANDMVGGLPEFWATPSKQCAAVRIVRELISEPVQNVVLKTGPTRLTTLGNWLPA